MLVCPWYVFRRYWWQPAGDLFGSAGGEIGIILTDLDFGL
jgi:hypothetical protein